ncbi:thioesterase family protein [Phenylobacterium sp.]|uniref:thioesterase family protein n=1 Tax=Phenylobacterium sp. TaxID=1871053 RepID=UPI00272F7BA6|nr:thioesterase family protein [Phenylobacterium sp.]MDP2214229.1 thioesterase family protein [Phenylobacterium sp.]
MDDAAPVRLHDFDEALPLHPAGPRLWDSRIDKRYWNMIGPWGGWTAALLLKAVLAEGDHGGTPVAMTVNLMGGLDESPLSLSTRPVRQGKSVEFWTSELIQNNAAVAMAMVTLGQRRETFSTHEASFPDGVTPPEAIEGVPGRAGFFTAMFETRQVSGSAPLQANDDSLTRTWVRDHQARPLDYPLLAGLADVFAPRIFYRSPERRPASTVSMSVYFHATPAELAAVGGDFVLAQAQARRFESGFFDQHGALWSRDGVLLATTEQLCWFK